MTTHAMKERRIPLNDRYDVIVVGGGPAGCAAAASAAREGAKTLLVEATFTLGGMGTLGLVPAWCPFSDHEKIVYRGIAERVLRETRAGMPHLSEKNVDWVPIDPERLKRVYDDLVTGAGAEVLFGTMLAAVETDGAGRACPEQKREVETLIVANKSGLSALKAKTYVDGTGDADLAAWAGAETVKGGESGEMQPATHCFILSNVDTYAYTTGSRLHAGRPGSPAPAIARDEKYPLIRDTHLCNSLIGPGAVGFNAGHLWDVDNTDPASVSKAMIEGRRIAAQFRDALTEYDPKAFADAFLVATGALMGIRETRRIVGDYVLTIDDYLARRSFPDEICRNSYPIDVHHAKNEIDANIRGEVNGMSRFKHYGPGESHGIPYRCLVPKKLANVLVAGRSISTDRNVQGSTRVMPVCLAMGEAAGMAAAMSALSTGSGRRDGAKGDVRAVEVQRLRARLREEGAWLPE